MAHEIISPQLVSEIEQQDRTEQALWLFLEQSEEFRGCWKVDALWPEYFFDFEPLIGSYRLVTPLSLATLMEKAQEWSYRVVFMEDPTTITDAYEHLRTKAPISLHSALPNTQNGMLPWQTIGFNKLVRDETLTAGYVVWCTGAGKTALIASALKYHQTVGHPFDLALVVVKSHNKIDMQRKLKRLGDIDSLIIEGTQQKRGDVYEQIELRLLAGQQLVAITNYEKIREDTEVFSILFKKRNLLCFWDEMPTKLSNPKTQLYRGVKRALYKSFYSRPNFKWARHWALTATPIENSPGDVWANINLMWPGLLGTQREFEDIHVASRSIFDDSPKVWKNLDRLEAKISFMTHSVSKDDPEVKAMFPTVVSMPRLIDWHPRHRSIYDRLTNKALDITKQLEDANILAMIQIMQMVCDAPSMIKMSAHNRQAFQRLLESEGDLPLSGPRGSEIAMLLVDVLDVDTLTDVGHTKLSTWREIICEKHPDEKIVTHSTWAQYIFPIWTRCLDDWGVSYVVYTGTDKQKQEALDRFRTEPAIRVFLSGDSGADSIDITEARVGVNYNIPWKWTKLQQRQGRRDRVDSTFDFIYTYDLIMANSVDERKLEICERKRQYHEAIFGGRVSEEAISATLTRDELLYLIEG